jgi:kynureninase
MSRTVDLSTDAAARDATDALAPFRAEFLIPPHGEGEQLYFCGNSLGLQPRATRQALVDELDDWAGLGVEAHFHGKHPWMPYHAEVREHLAEVVGALPGEVVAMNSLTVNLHLMMVSFYRPTSERPAILIEKNAFPSDRYAVESQVRHHGHDPASALIELEGDEPNGSISSAAIERALDQHGSRIALVMLSGVQYLTGQFFDLKRIAEIARRKGCVVGFDLAHAVGNVPVNLHDSGADFAVWCSYKYLNAGPGAIGGCFVHERHHDQDMPRFAGWWGHDKDARFLFEPDFRPIHGAQGWQISNPPILSTAPLLASLELFQRAGLSALRNKSLKLTGALRRLIEQRLADQVEIITPAAAEHSGCQLSLKLKRDAADARRCQERLQAAGVIGDWREPDILRVAPTPFYNSFGDVFAAVQELEAALRA